MTRPLTIDQFQERASRGGRLGGLRPGRKTSGQCLFPGCTATTLLCRGLCASCYNQPKRRHQFGLPASPRKKTASAWGELFQGADVSLEAVEFGRAMGDAQKRFGRLNAADPRVLAVAKALGYRRAEDGGSRMEDR